MAKSEQKDIVKCIGKMLTNLGQKSINNLQQDSPVYKSLHGGLVVENNLPMVGVAKIYEMVKIRLTDLPIQFTNFNLVYTAKWPRRIGKTRLTEMINKCSSFELASAYLCYYQNFDINTAIELLKGKEIYKHVSGNTELGGPYERFLSFYKVLTLCAEDVDEEMLNQIGYDQKEDNAYIVEFVERHKLIRIDVLEGFVLGKTITESETDLSRAIRFLTALLNSNADPDSISQINAMRRKYILSYKLLYMENSLLCVSHINILSKIFDSIKGIGKVLINSLEIPMQIAEAFIEPGSGEISNNELKGIEDGKREAIK